MVSPAHTTPNDIQIFDRDLIKQRRARALKNFSDHDFLFEWSKNQISDRLMDVTRNFDLALHIGGRCPISSKHSKINHLWTMDITDQNADGYIQASEEFLPFATQSLDMVMSNLCLHSVNDLPGTLLQIRQSLKPDGLFLASMLGGETLHELRQVLTDTELELYGGISPRISPFADKPQMGDLLQRAGYALPVVDSDIITVTYDNVFKLFADLRGMGESNTILARNKTPVGKEFFMRAAQLYHERHSEPDGRIVASFEVIFLLGWAPHQSQQKPLKPGSAKHSLAEALGTNEITAGEDSTP